MAGQVRDAFQAAYRLDPHSVAAAANLGDYYLQAPRLLGGGSDRVEQLASQLETTFPVEAHVLRARAAEQAHDDSKAEQELKAACALSASEHSEPAGRAWIALARYDHAKKQIPDMVGALRKAVEMDPEGGPILVQAAALLMRSGQEPGLAESWLRRYLGGSALAEEAPAFEVHVQLAHLLASQGRDDQARQQMLEAHQLASVLPVDLPQGSKWPDTTHPRDRSHSP